jgi:hypothetical protein
MSKMSVNRMKQGAETTELKETKDQETKDPTAAAKVLKLAAESVAKKDAEAAVESVTKKDPKASLEEVLRLAAGETKQEEVQLPAFPNAVPGASPCVTTPGPLTIPGMPSWVHPMPGFPVATPVSPCDPTVTPMVIPMTPQPTEVPCAMTTNPFMPCAPTTRPCPTPKPPSCFSDGLPGDMKNFKIETVRESALYGMRDFYKYTFYIGGRVEQRRVGYPDFFYNLGNHGLYNGMTEELINGDAAGCPDGTARSSTVHYQQGPPGGGNLLLWAGEVTQCHYEFFLQIDPNMCHPGLKKINVIVGYNVLPPEPTPCMTTTGLPCGFTEPPGPPLGNLTIVIPPPLHVPAAGQVAIPANVPEYTLVPLTTTPPAMGSMVPAQIKEEIYVPTMIPVTPPPTVMVPAYGEHMVPEMTHPTAPPTTLVPQVKTVMVPEMVNPTPAPQPVIAVAPFGGN